MGYAWGLGLGGLLVSVAVGHDVLGRVEIGYLVGSVIAATAMGCLMVGPLRRAIAPDWVPDSAQEPR